MNDFLYWSIFGILAYIFFLGFALAFVRGASIVSKTDECCNQDCNQGRTCPRRT